MTRPGGLASVQSDAVQAHVREIREADVRAVQPLFPAGARVLEIGGGNGLQASIIASWGCRVTSIDIQLPPAGEPMYFDVLLYDGAHLPFRDGQFDVVFSSNVLEHVPDPAALLRETKRVLRPGGRAIHIIPSVAWRFWTLVAHYPHLARRAAGVIASGGRAPGGSATRPAAGHSDRSLVLRVLIAPPHGEYPTALSELHYFRRGRWKDVFAAAGFAVTGAAPNRLFLTGYRLAPWLGVGPRRALARVLGSSCNVFTMETGGA